MQGVETARSAQTNLVVALGGGRLVLTTNAFLIINNKISHNFLRLKFDSDMISAIDCGKAIAMLLTNGGEPIDYMVFYCAVIG